MNDEENPAHIASLGLLAGEQVKLQLPCSRKEILPSVISQSGIQASWHKGVLVVTNDNMIFMQKEGEGSGSDYSQALRIPLENVVGVTAGKGLILHHIRFVLASSETHEFIVLRKVMKEYGSDVHEIRAEIETLLRQSREERKRVAQAALAQGTIPQMIFCRFCGARNKSDQMKCGNCGALLK